MPISFIRSPDEASAHTVDDLMTCLRRGDMFMFAVDGHGRRGQRSGHAFAFSMTSNPVPD